jgi:hypothetical protein
MSRELLPDDRAIAERMTDMLRVWAYIVGLSTMLVVWALIAWATIGSGTRILPNYNLPNPTPAAQKFNTLREFQRPRR